MIAPAEGGVGHRRRARLAWARLYVVTDARAARDDLAQFLDRILAAGVDIVQLREKEAEAGDLLRWGQTFKDAAARHGALFVVNDRPDVAVALEADGVHVGQNDLPIAVVRRLVGPEMIVGLSTHSQDEIAGASPRADYVCVGPVHETPTKAGRPATGLGLVRFAATQLRRRPWFAIGGLDGETVPAVVGAGATRIVVVRAITRADDPAQAVEDLLSRLPGGDPKPAAGPIGG